MDKRIKGILIIFVLCILMGFFFSPDKSHLIPGFAFILEKFHRFELNIYDYYMNVQGTYPPSEEIVIVALDEKSEGELGAFPWPRGNHGRLIEQLSKDGCKIVAFDVGFIGNTVPEQDQQLVDAAKKYNNMIAVVLLSIDASGNSVIAYPYDELRRAMLDYGYAETNRDQDHTLRKIQVINNTYKGMDPFVFAILKHYLPLESKLTHISPDKNFLLLGERRIPLEPGYNMLINFCGVLYPRVSYVDAMKGDYGGRDVRGKIALVMSTTDPFDQFKTPRAVPMPNGEKDNTLFGGEVHANAIQTVLEDRYIRHASDFHIWLTGCILCILVMAFLVRFNHLQVLPVFIGELVLYFFFCRYLFVKYNFWINYLIPMIMVSVFWFGIFIYESKRLKNVFTQFLPKSVVEKMMTSEKESQLGGKTLEASILFSDIRGYTTLSENLNPEDVIAMLNEYHKVISLVVEKNRGTTLDFAGDGTLVAFGIPEKIDNHALWAVRAARDMQKEIIKLNKDISRTELPLLQIGIGICTGKVAYGLVGQKNMKKYTVIGDVVNTASRIQGLSAELSSPIIFDKVTRNLVEDNFKIKDLGEATVKGKAEPLRVFSIDGDEIKG